MERRGSGLEGDRGERSSSRERRDKKEKKDTKEKKEKKDKGSRHSTPNALASPNERERKERRGSRREREGAGGGEVRSPPTGTGGPSFNHRRIDPSASSGHRTPRRRIYGLCLAPYASLLCALLTVTLSVPHLPDRICSLDRMTCCGKWSAS